MVADPVVHVLRAENIVRSFVNGAGVEVRALDGFSFSAEGPQTVAIVGPSGCGKSTFLRLVAGLDEPQAGTVVYDGTATATPSPDRGLVFQDAALFPWLTVYDNIAFGLRARGAFNRERGLVDEYIALMGLAGFERSYPHQLSGGMASRTGLARMFIGNPGLILLDEPLSALDAFTRMGIQDEIVRMQQRERSLIVLVTHDIEEAVYLADRVVIMSARPGHVIGEVGIDLSRPRDRIAEAFVAKRREVMAVLGSTGALGRHDEPILSGQG